MATVSVRYIVRDVETAVAFYRDHLGFTEQMRAAATSAMLTRGGLRLLLSASLGELSGGHPMPASTRSEAGGWNRFALEVDDLEQAVDALRVAGVSVRNKVVADGDGKRILVQDPSGNPVELFQPTHARARAESVFEVRPIGHVESDLAELRDAPNQGDQGAPDAWLVIDPEVSEGIRDISVGDELLVLTWLHHSRRDELATVPGDDPTGPERGVFSTRSPARPNPVGLHRVSVIAVADARLQVHPLEAIDGTPVVDIKPVIRAAEA